MKTLKFKSGATVQIPEGVQGKLEGNKAEFSIPGEIIEMKIYEREQGAKEALEWVRSQEGIMTKASQEMEQASSSWDKIVIQNYLKDDNLTQIVSKEFKGKSWVFFLSTSMTVIEKRMSLITEVSDALKVPGHEKTSLKGLKQGSILKKTQELEEFIQKGMQDCYVKGLSLAIVESGKVVYAKGFGQLGTKNQNKVDSKTQFMIGSVTKSMTTFVLGKLVEQGKISWNDRVIDLYPEFKLADQKLTESMTIKDLVSASTGIPRRDVALMLSHFGRKPEHMMESMKYLAPSTDKGEAYQYNNQLVAAAGFVAAKVAYPKLSLQEGFERLIQENFFKPLGMDCSTSLMTHVKRNHATPTVKSFNGPIKDVDLSHEHFAEYEAPAGGVWSTAEDMGKYIITELQQGLNPEGTRVLSADQILFRRTPQAKINNELSYALGWMVGKSLDLDIVTHGGSTLGFASNLMIFPKSKSGIIVLSNSRQGHPLVSFVCSKILELWYNKDLKSEDGLSNSLKMNQDYEDSLLKSQKPISDEIGAKILGKHFNEEIGTMTISKDSSGYKAEISGQTYTLGGLQMPNEDFKLVFTSGPFAGFPFELLFNDGKTLRLSRAQEEYLFEKQ